MDNVVAFPHQRVTDEPMTLDDVNGRISNIRMMHVELCLEEILVRNIDLLAAAGFEVDGAEFSKDLAMLCTAFRSMMLKVKGVEHPMQKISDDLFTINGDGEIEMIDDWEGMV